MGFFGKKNDDESAPVTETVLETQDGLAATVAHKNQWQKIWPILAAGSGLFSEGYVQSVCLHPEAGSHCSLRSTNRSRSSALLAPCSASSMEMPTPTRQQRATSLPSPLQEQFLASSSSAIPAINGLAGIL